MNFDRIALIAFPTAVSAALIGVVIALLIAFHVEDVADFTLFHTELIVDLIPLIADVTADFAALIGVVTAVFTAFHAVDVPVLIAFQIVVTVWC